MADLMPILADLHAESADADRLVADLPEIEWQRPTPAAGWTIAHQVAHLSWSDHAALLAVTDAEAFTANLVVALEQPESFVDRGTGEFLTEPPALLARWRSGRAALAEAFARMPAGARVPWYGTDMSIASMATARIMETWAHGLDIADTLGVRREPTGRLRHIAHLGVRTMAHSFLTHGLPAPTAPVRVELAAPGGATWAFGPSDATDRLTGPALDFCLLVTQRRHRADLGLVATGPVAEAWLGVAQCFAGLPGPGRPPGFAPGDNSAGVDGSVRPAGSGPGGTTETSGAIAETTGGAG